jgi:hypothetical protein
MKVITGVLGEEEGKKAFRRAMREKKKRGS